MTANTTTYSPFFNNKETTGRFWGDQQVIDFKERVKHNRKRGLRMSAGKREARKYIRDIESWWFQQSELDLEVEAELSRVRRNLNECCNHTLLREHADGTKEFMGAHTCKNKICPICNARRSKEIRRRYIELFKKNPDLLQDYDFFHLTLTVPHSTEGYKGKSFYADELIKDFNQMRRRKFWKDMVYAGEFGVEVTRNDSGLHIHIHALLLVHKSKQNRNRLHKELLKAWNKQTAGEGTRQQFSPGEVEAILKSNKLLTEAYVSKLAPSGATLIGLESLYTISDTPKPGYILCPMTNQYKKYIQPSDGLDTMMFGVLECIKYHFEPMALKKDGRLDVELLCELLPNIKHKKLYQRFGAFYGGCKNAHKDVDMLNLSTKSDDAIAQIEQDLKGVKKDKVVHPESGQEVTKDDYQYLIVRMESVFIDEADHNRIKLKPHTKKSYLPRGTSLEAALLEMALRSMDSAIAAKKTTHIKRLNSIRNNQFFNHKNLAAC